MAKKINTVGPDKVIPFKLLKDIRMSLKGIVSNELELIPETLEKLEPEDRLVFVLKLLPYVLPKVDSVSMHEGEPWDL